ncbi:hypothetical protein ACWEN6_03055 [Sphaerisporangium sp. NPDC004334]
MPVLLYLATPVLWVIGFVAKAVHVLDDISADDLGFGQADAIAAVFGIAGVVCALAATVAALWIYVARRIDADRKQAVGYGPN